MNHKLANRTIPHLAVPDANAYTDIQGNIASLDTFYNRIHKFCWHPACAHSATTP